MMNKIRTLLIFAALAGLFLTAFATLAGEPQEEGKKTGNTEQGVTKAQDKVPAKTQEKAPAKDEKKVAPGGAAMVVSIDASRGTIDPTPELSDEMREALGRMINTSSEGLVEEKLSDGTVLVDLKGRFRSAMVATVGEDGKLHTKCFSADPNHKHVESCNPVKEDEKKETEKDKPKKE